MYPSALLPSTSSTAELSPHSTFPHSKELEQRFKGAENMKWKSNSKGDLLWPRNILWRGSGLPRLHCWNVKWKNAHHHRRCRHHHFSKNLWTSPHSSPAAVAVPQGSDPALRQSFLYLSHHVFYFFCSLSSSPVIHSTLHAAGFKSSDVPFPGPSITKRNSKRGAHPSPFSM